MHLISQLLALDTDLVIALNVQFAGGLPKIFNASSQRNKQIKLTYFDVTKKRAIDSQGVRAKENL